MMGGFEDEPMFERLTDTDVEDLLKEDTHEFSGLGWSGEPKPRPVIGRKEDIPDIFFGHVSHIGPCGHSCEKW